MDRFPQEPVSVVLVFFQWKVACKLSWHTSNDYYVCNSYSFVIQSHSWIFLALTMDRSKVICRSTVDFRKPSTHIRARAYKRDGDDARLGSQRLAATCYNSISLAVASCRQKTRYERVRRPMWCHHHQSLKYSGAFLMDG